MGNETYETYETYETQNTKYTKAVCYKASRTNEPYESYVK